MRYVLCVILILAGCTKKTVTTSTDRTEVVEVDRREIPPVTFEPPSRDKLFQYKVVNETDTVYIKYREVISKYDTVYETIIDCPDMIDTTRTVKETTTKVIEKEKTKFGRFVSWVKNSIFLILAIFAGLVMLLYISKKLLFKGL